MSFTFREQEGFIRRAGRRRVEKAHILQNRFGVKSRLCSILGSVREACAAEVNIRPDIGTWRKPILGEPSSKTAACLSYALRAHSSDG